MFAIHPLCVFSQEEDTLVDGEGEVEKPQEPYRRMLTDGVEDIPVTPRKRLMNFKIPHVTRTSQRRETVVVARRRLYEGDERERLSSEGKGVSPDCHMISGMLLLAAEAAARKHRPSLFSDISSEDLSSDSDQSLESEVVRMVLAGG